MEERLDGKNIGVLFIGPVDGTVRSAIERTLSDAGAGLPVRLIAVDTPVNADELDSALNGDQTLAQYAESGDDFASLGTALGRELVDGEGTPTWSSLSSNLVEERSGASTPPLDGVVVVRSWTPPEDPTAEQEAQAHATETLLDGLLNGVQESRVPVVGVETTTKPRRRSTSTGRKACPAWTTSRPFPVASRWLFCSPAAPLATTVSRPRRPTGSPLRSTRCRSRVADLTVLIAARNEEERIGETVTALREEFGDAEILVVDGASTDRTAAEAEAAGAVVLRFAERGKGEALTAGERMVAPGPLLLCDADLRGSLAPLAEGDADLRVAAFTRRVGGGFGLAKRAGRELIRLRTGFTAREPLSGQRRLSEQARAAVLPACAGIRV